MTSLILMTKRCHLLSSSKKRQNEATLLFDWHIVL